MNFNRTLAPTVARKKIGLQILQHVRDNHMGIPPIAVSNRNLQSRSEDGLGLEYTTWKKLYRKVWPGIVFVKNGSPYVPMERHALRPEPTPTPEEARETPLPMLERRLDRRASQEARNGGTKAWERDKADPLQGILAALRGQRTVWGEMRGDLARLSEDVEKMRVEVGALSELIVKTLADKEAAAKPAAGEEVPDGSETAEQH